VLGQLLEGNVGDEVVREVEERRSYTTEDMVTAMVQKRYYVWKSRRDL